MPKCHPPTPAHSCCDSLDLSVILRFGLVDAFRLTLDKSFEDLACKQLQIFQPNLQMSFIEECPLHRCAITICGFRWSWAGVFVESLNLPPSLIRRCWDNIFLTKMEMNQTWMWVESNEAQFQNNFSYISTFSYISVTAISLSLECFKIQFAVINIFYFGANFLFLILIGALEERDLLFWR